MDGHIDLLAFDDDGALEETADAVGVSRADLLRKAAIGGSALVASSALMGMLPGVASAAATASAGDIAILNYALTLEYLEEAFYSDVQSNKILKGRVATFAEVAGRDEAQHRAFLVKALGAKAIKKPSFSFGSATQSVKAFEKTAIALEDTGVSAYAGQGPKIQDKKIVAAALSVHSVEARHAAWIRTLVNAPGRQGAPAPVPFDPARSMTQVLGIVKSTGFITG
jgi:hypothetical protein